MHLWVPTSDMPSANCIADFGDETYTLAEFMWHIQSDIQQHGFLFPRHFAALMALVWRLHPPLERFPSFISQLRRVHPSMPQIDGTPILSYHEFAISTGARWRNWPYDEGLLRVADVGAAPTPRDHPDHFNHLANLVAERFAVSGRKWPFEPIPFPTLLDCIEFEADRVGPESKGPQVSGESPSRSSDRLTVDLSKRVVILDGKPFDVASEQALRWVKVLADRPGVWVSSRELESLDTDLVGVRTDKLRRHLPVEILKMIESRPGTGSRLMP
jgi:hypothetical protein